MSKAEEWRDIPTYEMYQASSLGEIMRKVDGLILKQYIQKMVMYMCGLIGDLVAILLVQFVVMS